MDSVDSRRRAAHVLAGILAHDLAEDGSWPVEIERLGAAWPDPALPPLADGMTASETREQVNGYLTAALGITRQPASS
jgi:phage-related minor tail protein